MYIGLQVLRAKIRGLQSAGESIHHRIRKAKGLKRNNLWVEKRTIGNFNREHLIAYGLLRGIPYERIEKCAKENKPNAEKVFELMMTHADWTTRKDLTLDRVNTLLERTTTSESAVASSAVTSELTPTKSQPLPVVKRLLKAIPLTARKSL